MLTSETVKSVVAELHGWAAKVVAHASSTEPPPSTVDELKERVSLLIDSRSHYEHWLDDDLLDE